MDEAASQNLRLRVASTKPTGTRSLREASEPRPPVFGLRTLLWCLSTPLTHRFSRGEGQLLAVNASIGLWAFSDVSTLLAQGLISLVVLVLLYLFNDVHDCRHDLHDQAKNRAFVEFCVLHRGRLYTALAAMKLCTFALAWLLLGAHSASAVAAIFLINVFYSTIAKGVLLFDVPFVALWGASYALVPGVALPLSLIAMVGVMTGVCHVFQIRRDLAVDRRNHIATSAVAKPWLPLVELALFCAALGVALHFAIGLWAAVTAVVPLLLYLAAANQRAWVLSKAYYGVVWLTALVVAHAG